MTLYKIHNDRSREQFAIHFAGDSLIVGVGLRMFFWSISQCPLISLLAGDSSIRSWFACTVPCLASILI